MTFEELRASVQCTCRHFAVGTALGLIFVAANAPGSLALEVEKEAAEELFSSCFFPEGKGRINKLPADEIQVYLNGDRFSVEQIKKKLEYFSEELNGAKAVYSIRGVRLVISVSDDIHRDAIKHYDNLFSHIHPSREEFISSVHEGKSIGANLIESYKFDQYRFEYGTILFQYEDNRDVMMTVIDHVVLRLLFPNTQDLHDSELRERCLSLLDPKNQLGRWVGRFFNHQDLQPGMSRDQAIEVLGIHFGE